MAITNQNKNWQTFLYQHFDGRNPPQPVDLTAAVTVTLLVKDPAGTESTATGSVSTVDGNGNPVDPTFGWMTAVFKDFNVGGMWTVQFMATLPASEPLYGKKLPYPVVANVDD